MGRSSKVGTSIHKDSYINMRKNGMSLTELSSEAHKRGDNISPMSFSRYFSNNDVNVHQAIKERIKMVKNNAEQFEGKQKESVSILGEITRNLYTLQALTNALITNNPTDARTVNSCTQLLKESRLTLEYLDKKRKDMLLDSETSEEMGIATLMRLLKEIPSNCPHCSKKLGIIEKIEKKLDNE